MKKGISDKFKYLKKLIAEQKSLLIAFSGGVDSSFLLKIAVDVLKEKTIAVTTHSAIYKTSELEFSKNFAKKLKIKHIIINVNELSNQEFASNPYDRCYHCKSMLFDRLAEIAREHNLNKVADGTNYDDITDYRPGMTAASEFNVFSPLKDAGLTKKDIRFLSHELNLPTWDKASQPCLSTRFPYGTKIIEEKLALVEKAEDFIQGLGFKNFRVRISEDKARLEIDKIEMNELITEKLFKQIETRLKEIGYKSVVLDPSGYRSGSMNHFLKSSQ